MGRASYCSGSQIQATYHPCSAVWSRSHWSSGSPLRATAIFRSYWNNEGTCTINNREIIFQYFLFTAFVLVFLIILIDRRKKFLDLFATNLRAHETGFFIPPCSTPSLCESCMYSLLTCLPSRHWLAEEGLIYSRCRIYWSISRSTEFRIRI